MSYRRRSPFTVRASRASIIDPDTGRIGDGFVVEDRDGNIIAQRRTRKAAQDYADREAAVDRGIRHAECVLALRDHEDADDTRNPWED